MITRRDFDDLQKRFGTDRKAFLRYLHDHWRLWPIIDHNLILVIKKLRDDLGIENFVETGTESGHTSLTMTVLFDHVYTCDTVDHPKRPEFYLQPNLTYETKNSPDFLREHMPVIKEHSIFCLDAHGAAYWPLLDELAIIFKEAIDPVIIIDDYDTKNGLLFDSYNGHDLNAEYISPLVPQDYRFCTNPWSNRSRGIIFLFPDKASYGCPWSERKDYDEAKHGLWDLK